jgi:isopenicillin-N N-acyltransferase like protein
MLREDSVLVSTLSWCVILLIFLGLTFSPANAAEVASANKLRVVALKGTPYERGFQHGKALRPEIHALIKLWKSDLTNRFSVEPDRFIHSFFRNTKYRPAIERWTPELLDEIKGIAEGSGLDFETVFVYQLVDEYWVQGKMTGEHCSSIGVMPSKGKPAIVAQNLDLESFRDGFQTLLRIEHEDGLKTFVVTFPGFIGASGLNSKGVAVVPNTLDQLNNSDDGLPVACLIRGVLNQPSVAEAESFLKGIKHASGQNYLIGGPERIVDLECSSSKIVQYGEGQEILWHTNHSLKSEDFTPGWITLLKEKPKTLQGGSSLVRFEAIANRIREMAGTLSVQSIKTILQSKDSPQFPVCRPNKGEQGFTFASTIMVLGSTPELHIAPGPPDANGYQLFRF